MSYRLQRTRTNEVSIIQPYVLRELPTVYNKRHKSSQFMLTKDRIPS